MEVIAISYNIIAIVFLVIHYRQYSITPPFVFVATQLLMFNGIILAQDADTGYGEQLIYIYFSALLCFLLGVSLINVIYNIAGRRVHATTFQYYVDIEPSRYQMSVIFVLVAISIAICSWFYAEAGVNVFIASIIDIFRGDTGLYASDRESFFHIPGMGYIYQFRTTILPLLNLFLLLGNNKRIYKKIGICLLPFTTVFLLGTGQRNAFVFVVMISLLYAFLLWKNFNLNISKKKILGVVTITVFFLSVLTIANGRVAEESDNMVMGAISSLSFRVFEVNQITALSAFRYIETQPTVWGYDWLMMLADILPGKSDYLSVDRIVFYFAYGNYNGTGPPCIWGSAWYNWSWLGVTVFPLLLGLIYQSSYRYYDNIVKTKLHVLLYSALCTHLGLWFCGGPVVLFNNGVVTVLIMMGILFIKQSSYKDL